MPHLEQAARADVFRKYERALNPGKPVRRATLGDIAALGIQVETVPVEHPSPETRDTAGHDEQPQTARAAEPAISDL